MQRDASPAHSSVKERRSGIGGRSEAGEQDLREAASRFEPLDVPPWLPFWLAVLLAAFVVGVLVAISIGYPLATHQEYRGPLKALPPAPTLQTAPGRDLQNYQRAKTQELSKGAVPITEAMKQTAQRGWGPPK
jgi:hypothetical protein